MNTFESVQAKVRTNFSSSAVPQGKSDLQWKRESISTIVSTCNRFRISRMVENGTETYWAWTVATETQAPKGIGGRFIRADEAKDACQFRAVP